MILNKRAEDFLTKLKLELIFRGREEDEIDAVDEELRDHFATAEKNGENVDNLINQPVKSYADRFAKEMRLSKGIYRFAFSLLIFFLALTIIPSMFDAHFQLSLMFLFKIIGMLATGKNYGSHYTMISLILILIGWFLFSAIGGWITFRKRKE